MIYATFIGMNGRREIKQATIIEPYTGIGGILKADELKTLIKNGVNIANITLENDVLHIADWPHMIRHRIGTNNVEGCDSALVGIRSNEEVYIADTLGLHIIDKKELTRYIRGGYLANCTETQNRITYIQTTDMKEKKSTYLALKEEYDKFLLKTRSIGLDLQFEFITYGNHIMIKNYTGTSKNVVIPKFVYAIASTAFRSTDVETVVLNDGLRIIGNMAFYLTCVQHINIPNSVQLVGRNLIKSNWINFENKNTVQLHLV